MLPYSVHKLTEIVHGLLYGCCDFIGRRQGDACHYKGNPIVLGQSNKSLGLNKFCSTSRDPTKQDEGQSAENLFFAQGLGFCLLGMMVVIMVAVGMSHVIQ